MALSHIPISPIVLHAHHTMSTRHLWLSVCVVCVCCVWCVYQPSTSQSSLCSTSLLLHIWQRSLGWPGAVIMLVVVRRCADHSGASINIRSHSAFGRTSPFFDRTLENISMRQIVRAGGRSCECGWKVGELSSGGNVNNGIHDERENQCQWYHLLRSSMLCWEGFSGWTSLLWHWKVSGGVIRKIMCIRWAQTTI